MTRRRKGTHPVVVVWENSFLALATADVQCCVQAAPVGLGVRLVVEARAVLSRVRRDRLVQALDGDARAVPRDEGPGKQSDSSLVGWMEAAKPLYGGC